MAKRHRPEQPFKNFTGVRPSDTDTDEKGRVDKRAFVVSAEPSEGDTGGLISQALFTPNDEQLEKINQFTLRTVHASEVACFTTHSCNDLLDRDDDRFSTKCVKGFANLPQPYSPTGKSYMVAHDTSKLGVGRLFDTGTKSIKLPEADKSVQILTNDVYVPRTAANETFIENLEFGINWAVSVGVVLGKAECMVGEPHPWGAWSWWCSAGHDKGFYYDPNSDEEDDWGWPAPVSESKAGAVKCFREFDDPVDMYELSQVYCGAQYWAAVMEKDPELSALVKSPDLPIVGMGRKQAKNFSFPKLPERALSAAKNHSIKEEEGTFLWTDDAGLVWSFTPGEDAEPLLLGKKAEGAMERSELNAKVQDIKSRLVEAKGEMENKSVEGAGVLATQLDGLLTEIDEALDQGDLDSANPLVDQAQTVMDQLFDELYENEEADPVPDDDPGAGNESQNNYNPQGDSMSKKAVLTALAHVKAPTSVIEAVSLAPEEGTAAFDLAFQKMGERISELEPKAAAGDQYVKDLRSETLDWYRKAKQNPQQAKGVDVSHIERILDSVGDNVVVIRSLLDDYKAEAESRFGKSVRRSSVESDVNHPNGQEAAEQQGDFESRVDTSRVARIHG